MKKKTNKRKYSVVNEMEIINIILETAEHWNGCEVISPSNITSLLKTSRYQVNKHIKSLKNKGFIQYKSVMVGPDDDYYPPINGYCLSEKGKKEFEKELKEISDRELKLIQECFGS